jgi:hypothetical protein
MTSTTTPADNCSVAGCSNKVSKPGHTLCYEHWKLSNQSQPDVPKKALATLTTTALGERLGLTAPRMNQVLSELGWIEKQSKGWVASTQGVKLCAEGKKANNGIPYVVWPEAILTSRILTRAVAELAEPDTTATAAEESKATYGNNFRKRFPATHRATDGHMVRSKAEALIDDWLYSIARLPHAYERRVPIEENLYCDFFLPQGKVYIEYWGIENDPQYLARKQEKQALYAKHDLNLIELNDEHVRNLDDHLPKLLRRFGIHVD